MEPRISLITLGVVDLDRSVRFYRDGLRLPQSSVGDGQVAFMRTGGAALALYPRESLTADVGLPTPVAGFGGITLAHNVRHRALVDVVLAEAVAAGGTLVRPAQDTEWGGYVGYFADPDGYVWEIAWNPGFPFAIDGSVIVPE